jgi:hypothetical protein
VPEIIRNYADIFCTCLKISWSTANHKNSVIKRTKFFIFLAPKLFRPNYRIIILLIIYSFSQSAQIHPRLFSLNKSEAFSLLNHKINKKFYAKFNRCNRNAFPITDIELKLIAAAPKIGFNNIPVQGNNTPAAIGIQRKL